ncbi:reverse transcriptase domain-containing protein [Tanacetum coccineum]
MTLAFIAARPPCFDLSSFVKKIALLSQFEHEKIARYYGADKVAIEYRSITHGVGIILKEKRPSVRGKDHFVDEQKYPCVNPHYHTIRCEEKESTLAYYHRIHGNKWAEIAKHLPGRLLLVGASFTQRKVSSIPTIFSWGNSISPDGFLPSILLLVMIIVAVVIVVVTVVLVVVIGEGWENEFHQDKASSVRVLVANFTLQSSVQFLRENTDSVHLNQRMRPTSPSVPLKLKGWQLINSL